MNENKKYVLRWNVGDTENTYVDVTNSSGLGITGTMAMLLVVVDPHPNTLIILGKYK